MGFKRVIYQMKACFFLSISTNMMTCVIQKIYIKIPFFHFLFLNEFFSFTIISPTLELCNPIDNLHLERTMSQISHLGPSFCLM